MDHWENIRRLARMKHQELVQDAEYYTVEELLLAAEKQTGIERESVPSNDSLLGNAEAVLDIDARKIWVSEDTDPYLAAYHQAHEYAHYWIDGNHFYRIHRYKRQNRMCFEYSDPGFQLSTEPDPAIWFIRLQMRFSSILFCRKKEY